MYCISRWNIHEQKWSPHAARLNSWVKIRMNIIDTESVDGQHDNHQDVQEGDEVGKESLSDSQALHQDCQV